MARTDRLTSADRRDVLLDAVAALIEEAGVASVSMDGVAERAGVSRTLLYKHFANRAEMLAELYRREAGVLHNELAAEVGATRTLEGAYRALIRGGLRATTERSALFSTLRGAGAWNRELRQEQHERDVDTVRFFTKRAVRELGVAWPRAEAATAMLLAAIEPILPRFRRDPTPRNAAFLEETYLGVVLGALTALASPQQHPPSARASGRVTVRD